MSVNSEIQRISAAVASAYDAVDDMGGTLPSSEVIANLPTAIRSIPQTTSVISVTEELDSHGGTIKHINGVNISGDTVTAAHLESGYTAHDRAGNAITGTLVAGGGGLEYESGTWIPNVDIGMGSVSFTNTHTSRPMYVIIQDVTNSVASSSSNLFWAITSWYDGFGAPFLDNYGSNVYARTSYAYMSSGSVTYGGVTITELTGDRNTMANFLSASAFGPTTGSTSRYWRAGRTYKWIAVWAPTS